jgi:hypothetical protein
LAEYTASETSDLQKNKSCKIGNNSSHFRDIFKKKFFQEKTLSSKITLSFKFLVEFSKKKIFMIVMAVTAAGILPAFFP